MQASHPLQDCRQPSDESAPAGRVYTVTILSFAFIARLLVLAVVLTQYPANWFFTKGLEMGLLANSLLNGQGLSSPFGPPTGPTAFFAPAYPLLVSGVFRLAGAFSLSSAIVIILAQIILNLLTVWLVMQISLQLFDTRTANIAGTIWACSLPLLWLPHHLLGNLPIHLHPHRLPSLALRCTRKPNLLHWLGMGAYCGLTALINPALLPATFSIFAWSAYKTRNTSWLTPVLGLLIALIVFSPWPLRNARTFHAFVPTRSNIGSELWIGNHPGASGYLEESLFPSFNQAELADYKARGEIGYNANKSAITERYIQANPLNFFA